MNAHNMINNVYSITVKEKCICTPPVVYFTYISYRACYWYSNHTYKCKQFTHTYDTN